MSRIVLPPLRSWNNFLPDGSKFSRPAQDPIRWTNRVNCNLLYFQTNYLVLALGIVLFHGVVEVVGYLLRMPPGRLHREGFLARPAVRKPRSRPRTRWRDYISSLVWELLGIPQSQCCRGEGSLSEFMDAQRMLTAISAALVVTSASLWAAESNPSINNIRRQNNKEFVALVMLAGCILIYLLGCAMLLVTAVILPLTLILVHASCRRRNFRSKVGSRLEFTGLRRSPMGLLLEALGLTEETFLRIQMFWEGPVN